MHGISFEDAKFVFNDPAMIILQDLYHSENEERWLAIGIVNKILFVVFTERGENIIRLISARPATKAEEQLYHDDDSPVYSLEQLAYLYAESKKVNHKQPD